MNYNIFLTIANGEKPFHSYYSSIQPMKDDLITIKTICGLEVYQVKYRNLAGESNVNNLLLLVEKI